MNLEINEEERQLLIDALRLKVTIDRRNITKDLFHKILKLSEAPKLG